MEKFKLIQGILHTSSLTAERLKTMWPESPESDVRNWGKAYSMLDGQEALLIPSWYEKDEFIFVGLKDHERDKEVAYLMEQDSEVGCYIDQREDFDRDYDSGNYSRDVQFCLKSDQVEVITQSDGMKIEDTERIERE